MNAKRPVRRLPIILAAAFALTFAALLGAPEAQAAPDPATQATSVAPASTDSAAEATENALPGVPFAVAGSGASGATASALGGVTPLATPSHWTRLDGGGWGTTFLGKWTTVTDARALGVDVSEWNGTIDWAAAKRDGVDFAIIRCGYGTDTRRFDDKQFMNNVRGCLENAIPFGLYLYSYAENTDDARSEAEHVLRLLSEAGLTPADLDYPVYYDLEEPKYSDVRYRDFLASISNVFCTRIAEAGYEPGVYANTWWWTTFLTDPVFDNWERWIANWNYAGPDAKLAYDGHYGLWQFMSTGIVDGIGGVDVNFDYRDRTHQIDEIPEEDVAPESVYRLYNRWSGEHLYTGDLDEARTLLAKRWRYEGLGWRNASEGEPIYRLYNPHTTEHLYTKDENEYAVLQEIGWEGEGEKFHSADEDGTPIYRLFNPYEDGVKAHLFTADANEWTTLRDQGWTDEDICWYGLA